MTVDSTFHDSAAVDERNFKCSRKPSHGTVLSTHAGASTRDRSRDRARARDKKFIHPSRPSIASSRRVVGVGGPYSGGELSGREAGERRPDARIDARVDADAAVEGGFRYRKIHIASSSCRERARWDDDRRREGETRGRRVPPRETRRAGGIESSSAAP